MTFHYAAPSDFPRIGRRSLLRDLLSQSAFAAASLAVFGIGCACLYGSTGRETGPASLVVQSMAPNVIATKVAAIDSAVLAENYLAGRARFLFGQSAPLRANFLRPSVAEAPQAVILAPQVAAAEPFGPPMPAPDVLASSGSADVPMPAPRPREFALLNRLLGARQVAQTASPSAPTEQPKGVFERLFGGSSEPTGPALAYANPQDGVVTKPVLTDAAPLSTADRSGTAIYDISAKVVHLPDGTRLEAHSGLGPLLDDPRNVHVKMHGATPPAVYDLTLREKLFHGVQAIRLTPVNSRVFGRAGLLAHTFMLGPNGDSNGCVSFRNYDAFLQAFMKGQVKRLEVVAKL